MIIQKFQTKTSKERLKNEIELQSVNKFNYSSYSGDYQYTALHNGSFFQRFWHSGKLEAVNNLINFNDGEVILDFGCGSGNLCFFLSKKCNTIFGLDAKSDAIDFANKIKKEKKYENCNFLFNESSKLPFYNEYFDKVFLLDVIEHIENPRSILKEIKRVLKNDGVLVTITPNYASVWPIIEFLCDKLRITPKNREQHILKFTQKKLTEIFEECNFFIKKQGSFYLFSPFFAYWNISYSILKWEINTCSRGMLLYSITKKKD